MWLHDTARAVQQIYSRVAKAVGLRNVVVLQPPSASTYYAGLTNRFTASSADKRAQHWVTWPVVTTVGA